MMFRIRAGFMSLHVVILVITTALVMIVESLGGSGRGSIAFVSAHAGSADIYLMDVDRGMVRRLTDHPGEDLRPAWSPDGRRLIFYSNRAGAWNLYVMRASGLGVRQLTAAEARSGNPAWSPDGRWIAYDTTVAGNLESYIMNVVCLDWTSGCVVRRLTTQSGPDEFPAWSPDSQRIAYQALRQERREIYVLDVCKADPCASKPRLLDAGHISHTGPVWSPDGKQIAFAAINSAHWGIYVVNANCDTQPGGCIRALRRLTDERMDAFQPAWSLDGQAIVFQGWIEQNMELFVIDADGRNLRRLTTNRVDDRLAAWWP
ncbi:MAG: hypothetical protein K8I30_04390 [Anaerolineae bacterium]|nr:hypothetical protein [Anaerolineae bacterium]